MDSAHAESTDSESQKRLRFRDRIVRAPVRGRFRLRQWPSSTRSHGVSAGRSRALATVQNPGERATENRHQQSRGTEQRQQNQTWCCRPDRPVPALREGQVRHTTRNGLAGVRRIGEPGFWPCRMHTRDLRRATERGHSKHQDGKRRHAAQEQRQCARCFLQGRVPQDAMRGAKQNSSLKNYSSFIHGFTDGLSERISVSCKSNGRRLAIHPSAQREELAVPALNPLEPIQ